ncbi:hypothetical protein KP509_11G082000 [Ceratopteris richardii]|nr:hypothetical protein KP509_11G082000 [Ceratopteris richardii]
MARRMKEGLLRLGDLSLVAAAVGCGYIGYNMNSREHPGPQQKAVRRRDFTQADIRRIEETFLQLARKYDLDVKQVLQKRDEALKVKEEAATVSTKIIELNKEVSTEIEKLQKLMKLKYQLQHAIASLDQQKRSLDVEAEEISKLVKVKSDLQERYKRICLTPETPELQILSSMVHEKNQILEAEIEQLTRLVKVKQQLLEKFEALDQTFPSHTDDPKLKQGDLS